MQQRLEHQKQRIAVSEGVTMLTATTLYTWATADSVRLGLASLGLIRLSININCIIGFGTNVNVWLR